MKTNKRKVIAVHLVMAAVMLVQIFLTACIPAMASDRDVVFMPDPDDAVKGHIYVGAIVEEGFKGDINVELYPNFPEGNVHSYELTYKDGYIVNDDIMIGEYDAVAYLADAEDGFTAAYSAGIQEVTEGGNKYPYFAAVAGSDDFVFNQGWLSFYAVEKGSMLSGTVSDKDVQALFEETVALQNGYREGVQNEREDVALGSMPEEGASMGATEEVPAEQIQPEENVRNDAKRNPLIIVIPSLVGIGVIAALYVRRRK